MALESWKFIVVKIFDANIALGPRCAKSRRRVNPNGHWCDEGGDLNSVAALAGLSDTELAALTAATYGVPQTAPRLMAWIEHACDRGQHRRRDFNCELLPEATISPEEDAVNIATAMILRELITQDSPAVRAFVDALVELVGRGELCQACSQPADA